MNPNILVGAKHFGSKSLILTHKLCAEMLRPGPNEMHPFISCGTGILPVPKQQVIENGAISKMQAE